MASCKLVDCTIAKDARCLEGRGEACPNLMPENGSDLLLVLPADNDDVADLSSVMPSPSEALYPGLPLEISEAREFSQQTRTQVVSLAGMTESGKTSLLARLHQQFLAGPVAGYEFAGSRTLLRFEELNWKATVESRVSAPTMDHSSRQFDNSFLHLTVRKRDDSGVVVELLLNDISGETFPEAIAAESVCNQLLCLRRADHLALVVDGAAIADRSLRHDHIAKAMNFVQRVLQTGQIGKRTILHLIISKEDVLKHETHVDENDLAAKGLEHDFASKFRHHVAEIVSWRIAARPTDGSMPTTDEIDLLFSRWAGTTRRYADIAPHDFHPPIFARDFSRFGV
jgi:Double-GTPase 2